jgi:hypothetical protein
VIDGQICRRVEAAMLPALLSQVVLPEREEEGRP